MNGAEWNRLIEPPKVEKMTNVYNTGIVECSLYTNTCCFYCLAHTCLGCTVWGNSYSYNQSNFISTALLLNNIFGKIYYL